MSIEQIRDMGVFSPEEESAMDIRARVFDPGSIEVAPEDMPEGEFWKTERLDDNWYIARRYQNGEDTGYTIEDWRWPDPESPMCRVSKDEEYEVNGVKEVHAKVEFVGSFTDVYEKLSARFEEPKSELERLHDSVFSESSGHSPDDKVPHTAWVSSGDESMTAKIAGLMLDGNETPYRMRQFNGSGMDMPGYQLLKGDRLIYQGTLPDAIDRGVMRAERDHLKAQEKTKEEDQNIGARLLALASRAA